MANRRQRSRINNSDDSPFDINDLSEDGQKIVQAITAQIDLLREDFLRQMAEKEKEITRLKEVVTTLKCNVMKLEERLEDADAY